ncbi:MAG: hypothetical protein WDN04_18235 [Rhodospirillales bacterium]
MGEWVASDAVLLEQVLGNLIAKRAAVHRAGRGSGGGAAARRRVAVRSVGHRHRHRGR